MQFDHIFPKGEFTVTEKIDDYTLRASGMDFNLTDCLLDGVEVIVTFQDGGLAGYDLAIVEGSWDNDVKQFKLKQNEQENALKVPGDINFSVGDKFILTGLKMPQSYRDNASLQLQEEAQAWLSGKCEKRIQLRGKCDEVIFRLQNIFIACGQMVGVYSEQLDIDREIRVTRVKRYIEKDGTPSYRYELTLSDFLESNGFKDLVDDVNKVPEEIEDAIKPVREHTKRSWRDVMETLGMMFDPEGDYFTELIKPLAVHTAQLIVGTNSQQMELIGVKFIPNADNDPNYFKSTAGKLVHFTINEDEVREWTIPASSHRLNNALPYYVYAKCPREGNTGSILASERQIKLLDDPDYYHFWVGVLNTPEDNVRSWLPNYGFTEIAGQTITAGLIKDKLARLVIDLVNAKITASNGATIEGKVTFKSGTSGYNNISDRPNLQPLYDGVNDALTDAENASNAANNAQLTANNKARVFYQTTAPTSGMRTNDLWVDGVNIYRYSGSSWVLASKYDNTITEINGGLITTGAIAFGNTGGMSASGTIRIWSGGTAGTKGQPPTDPTFRVESNGNVESRGSIYIANSNGEKLAGLSGGGTSGNSVRIWAGNATPVNAPFKVYQNGDAYIGGLRMESGGLFSDNRYSGESSSKFFLYSSGSNAFLGFSSSGKWAGLGLNTLPSTLGGTSALMRLEYTTSHYDMNYGAVIDVHGGRRNYALYCTGGLRVNGPVSTARYIRPGAKSDAIINDIGYMDTFVFQTSTYLNVYLPSRATLAAKIGTVHAEYGESWSEVGYNSVIFINVLVSAYSSASIRIITEDANTPLVDVSGNNMSELVMGKGKCATFAYFNQRWYLFTKNF